MQILWYPSVRSILLQHSLAATNSIAASMLGSGVWFRIVTAFRDLQSNKNLGSLGLSRLG